MPDIAVIGGMAVNIRLSTAAAAHRATQDLDVVADNAVPSVIEILARNHSTRREHTVVVDGVEIDVIVTQAVTEEDLDGLDDGQRLFLAGHRWALDSARRVRLDSAGDGASVTLPVATPAGLVAAKSHAAGYPRTSRRASKHGGDLYDVFRLVEVFDGAGQLRDEIAAAPGGIARLVAEVVASEILASPVRAMRQMAAATAGGPPPDPDRITDVLEPFVEELLAAGLPDDHA